MFEIMLGILSGNKASIWKEKIKAYNGFGNVIKKI
jgi:hypothetical protein